MGLGFVLAGSEQQASPDSLQLSLPLIISSGISRFVSSRAFNSVSKISVFNTFLSSARSNRGFMSSRAFNSVPICLLTLFSLALDRTEVRAELTRSVFCGGVGLICKQN